MRLDFSGNVWYPVLDPDPQRSAPHMIRSKCSGIEVVITGLTRNQFAGNRTWVRIPPSPPARRKRHIACDELFPSRTKLIARSFCCFSLPKRNRLRWVALWGCRTAVLFYQGKNIDFNRPFQVGANVISFAPTSFYACGKRDVICPLSYANGFKSQGGS